MTRSETARAVALQLYTAENAVDDAIREAARLTLAVADARSRLNLAAVVGPAVFDRASALQAGLAAARNEAVALHEALAAVRDQLRIRMDGDDFGTPDKPPAPSGVQPAPEEAPGPGPVRRLRGV